MAVLLEDKKLRNRTGIFADRTEAGQRLVSYLRKLTGAGGLVLAIPSGGVPVGLEIRKALDLDFDLLIVRKVQIPWNTEAGFGAVNMDGDLILNEALMDVLRLSAKEVECQVGKTRAIIEQRDTLFRAGRPFPELTDKTVILVDDGLASGFTMKAAIAFVKRRKPASIIGAVPTGSAETVNMLLPSTSALCCLNIREDFPYAVASAYRHWYDLSDDDVLHMLGNA
jgi:putative phosphoribosyl transferase